LTSPIHLLFSALSRPPPLPLSPYTTLFRSLTLTAPDPVLAQGLVEARLEVGGRAAPADDQRARDLEGAGGELLRPRPRDDDRARSEERSVGVEWGLGDVEDISSTDCG